TVASINSSDAALAGEQLFEAMSNFSVSAVHLYSNATLSRSLPNVSRSLVVQGFCEVDYCAVDGAAAFHMFVANASAVLELKGLTLANGAAERGAALFLADQSTAVVENIWFTNNSATSGGAVYSENSHTLSITNSVFTGNTAEVSHHLCSFPASS
ncbi:hypothetical protein CYMTET_25253, partial [Cymbomonas tetramitiformis]